ncbi:MAG TPA: hypothetical protein VLJ59_09305 [Mycobacteriales bacterium]|nr:hypothetical protein [Mycobacteriales bacterium]
MTAGIPSPPDLDARYVPFPAFVEWRDLRVNVALVDAAYAAFEAAKAEVTPERLGAVLRWATRAAAYDTGAIEGLYPTDRGVTFTVAAATAAWEAVVEREAGAGARQHFEDQLAAYDLVLDAATPSTPITRRGSGRCTSGPRRASRRTGC